MDALYGSFLEADVTPTDSKISPSQTKLQSNTFLLNVLSAFLVGSFVLLFFLQIKISPIISDQEYLLINDCGDSNLRLECCTDQNFPVLAGVDVVAYFQIPLGSRAVIGNSSINSIFETRNGAFTFYFSNEENRNIFESDPWSYIPEVGGFDANTFGDDATSFDNVLRENLGGSIDLNQWTIINNRLYLFGNAMALHCFTSQEKKRVAYADHRWMQYFDSRWVSAFSEISDTVLNTQCILATDFFADDISEYVPDEARVHFSVQRTFALPPQIGVEKNQPS